MQHLRHDSSDGIPRLSFPSFLQVPWSTVHQQFIVFKLTLVRYVFAQNASYYHPTSECPDLTVMGSPPPIRACLFDMDGLLIDTEDLYSIVTNEVLRECGKPDLPWSIKAQMQGRPGPEVCTNPLH